MRNACRKSGVAWRGATLTLNCVLDSRRPHKIDFLEESVCTLCYRSAIKKGWYGLGGKRKTKSVSKTVGHAVIIPKQLDMQ